MSTKKISKSMRVEAFFGYLFIMPVVIGLAVFYFWPVIYCCIIAFMQWDGIGQQVFVGWDNYRKLFDSAALGSDFINTIRYSFSTVPITIVLSVMLACVVNSKLVKCKSIFKVILFLPSVTMSASISIVWRWMFNSKFGLVNEILKWFGIKGPLWLSDPNWLMPAIIIVGIWGGIGYSVILFLAGLQGIPATYYESAQLDGATALKSFFYITLPFLSPTIFFVSITSFINAFKVFDIIYIFGDDTGGMLLDSVKTMVYSIYRLGFVFRDMGTASAEAVLLGIIILVFTGLQFLMQKKWVYYE